MTAGRSLLVGLLAVFLAAGCGGDDGSGSSATEFADGACSATTTYRESIRATADSLRGGNLSEDNVRSAVDEIEAATNDFVDDLRGLGRPDTEAGQRAEELLDQLAADIEENVSTVRSAADGASGLSGIAEVANAASTALPAMEAQLSSTFAELEELDAGGELQTAFREADSCNQLESGGP
jgi:hypothetical protein